MNPIKTFYRHFKSNRQSCIINMLSLIPGLVCCTLILMWIIPELKIDRCYPNSDRIVIVQGQHEGRDKFGGAPPAVVPTLKKELAEVEKAARVAYKSQQFTAKHEIFNTIVFALDADFFDIFGIKFVDGRPFTEEERDKIVISQEVAHRVFGEASPIDSVISNENGTFYVCGVFEDMKNTSIMNDGNVRGLSVAISINADPNEVKHLNNLWYNNSYQSFFLLKDEKQFDEFANKVYNRALEASPENNLYLVAGLFKDRYLYDLGAWKQVKLMGIIALIVLIIACINFVNLATAAFSQTALQIGVRKVVGASRGGLIVSYLYNTSVLVFVSLGISLLVSYATMPFFCQMIGKELSFGDLFTWEVLVIMASIGGLVTLLTALYPAWYLSRLNPVKVLKGRNASCGGERLRQVLVITQFVASVVLIIVSGIIMKQINFCRNVDPGFKYNEIICISIRSDEQSNKAFTLKEELLKYPAIKSVSCETTIPMGAASWNGVGFDWDGRDPKVNPLVHFNYTDKDFAETYDLQFKEGGFFKDNSKEVVINRTLAELIGDDILDKSIIQDSISYQIVGVTDEFIFGNIKEKQEPYVFFPMTQDMSWAVGAISVRITGSSLTEMSSFVQNKADEIFGEKATVRYISDFLEYQLTTEKQLFSMTLFFSILAIFISCIGLFGLASFMIERRRKEIGVRRVNGAQVSEIMWMLNMRFFRLILISFIIAIPTAYYFMSNWLNDYQHKTTISWWIFVIACIFVLLIAFCTLTWQTVKAAMANPVDSLKDE